MLVLIGGTEGMEVPRRLEAKGVRFTCIPPMGREIAPRHDLAAIAQIRRQLFAFAPDLVSIHSSKAGVLGRLAALGLGCPVLYTPHCWSFSDGFPKAGLYRIIEKCLAPLATRIICVSEAERELGLQAKVGSADRTITIHNGVGGIPATAPPRAPADGTARLIMVGRFAEQKDHRTLLTALAGLAGLPWKLTLVGDGPTKETAIELARDLGIADRVEFLGYQSHVETELQHHDVFVLITNWEGFPRSILEAMRAGLPVVASDVGGCRESVVDGRNGRIVPKQDVAAVREALAELIASPETREAMGRASYESYVAAFNFDAMYRRYRDLYGELIAGGKTSAARAGAARPMPGDTSPELRTNHGS